MTELGNLLDKVVRASRTKEVKEALNGYCAFVKYDMSLRGKYMDRVEDLYRRKDPGLYEIRRFYDEDIYSEIYEMVESQRKRVIDLMGLSKIAEKDDMSIYFYRFGKGDFSDEEFIQLLINVVWDYFYSKKKSPINIQKVEKDENSFLVSFNEPLKIPTE